MRVFSEDTVGGLVVIFDVEENPVVRQISISGNDHLDGEKIRDILTLTLGSALDYPLLFENRARVEGLYRAQGYYLTDVSYEESRGSRTRRSGSTSSSTRTRSSSSR